MKKMMTMLLTIGCMAVFAQTPQGEVVKHKKEYTVVSPNEIIVKTFHANGELMEVGTFINGKPDGEWMSYDTEGRLFTRATFDNGVKTGVWTIYNFYDNEVLQVEYADNSVVRTSNWVLEENP